MASKPLTLKDGTVVELIEDVTNEMDACPGCGLKVPVLKRTDDGPQPGHPVGCFACGAELAYGPDMRLVWRS